MVFVVCMAIKLLLSSSFLRQNAANLIKFGVSSFFSNLNSLKKNHKIRNELQRKEPHSVIFRPLGAEI